MAKQVTLKNINEFTLQEIFDRVAKHLLNQNEIAKDYSGKCLYRVKKDNKVLLCAVGCLIPDKDYSENMEEQSINDLFRRYYAQYEQPDTLRLELLQGLQEIHDYRNVIDWRDGLIKLAKNRNLDFGNLV